MFIVHAYIRVYIRVWVLVCVCTRLWACAYIYMCVCVCVDVGICVHTCAYVFACLCIGLNPVPRVVSVSWLKLVCFVCTCWLIMEDSTSKVTMNQSRPGYFLALRIQIFRTPIVFKVGTGNPLPYTTENH
jgi:hypothetical protein